MPGIRIAIRRLSFVTILLFICSFMGAQNPPWQWAKQAHTPGKEQAWDVAADPASGNVYIGGSWDTNLSGTYGLGFLLPSGGMDALIAKYDATGALVWANKIGGNQDDEIKSICVDPTGNIYVAGYFNGTVDFDPGLGIANLTATAGQDGFLAKYSSAGVYQWAVKVGGTGADAALHCYADANGVYVTGYYNTAATFSSTTLASATTAAAQGGNNMFGAKYNAAGVVQWAISAGSVGNDQGLGVTADNNSVYFAGLYSDALSAYDHTGALALSMATPNPGNDGGFIMSLTQSGTFSWITNVVGDDITDINGLAQDATSLYITGGYAGTTKFPAGIPLFSLTSSGKTDFFLAKLSKANGTYQWVKTEPGSNGQAQVGYAVCTDLSGSIYLTGSFNKTLDFSGDGGPVLTSTDKADIFVASYSNTGVYQWVNQGGEKGDDIPYGISSDNTGSIYTGGNYAQNAVFGSSTLTKDGGPNLFVAKIGCNTLSNNTITAAQTICTGTTPAALAGSLPTGGSGAYAYTWEQSPDNITWSAATGVSNTQNYSPPALITSTYFRRKVSSTACSAAVTFASASILITVDKKPAPVFAGNDTSICGTASTFNATPPLIGTGTWTTFSGTGVYTNTQPHSIVTGLSTGSNKFIWTVSNGTCPAVKDTVSITSYKLPSKAFAGNDTSICGTSSVFAAAVPAIGTGAWSLLSGAGIPGGNLPRSPVSALGAGQDKFIWTVQNGACPVSKDTMMFIAYKTPSKAFAGNDTTICGSSSHFAASNPSVGTGAWSLYTGTGAPVSNAPRANVNGLSTGSDQFIWTVSNGVCPVSRDTMKFSVPVAASAAYAGKDTSVCGTAAVFNATAPAVGSGIWSVLSGTGIYTAAQAHSTVTGLSYGKNTFIWSVSNGVCPPSRDTVNIFSFQTPSKAFAGNDTTICGSSSHFAASTPSVGTGAWSLYTGTGIPASNAPRANVSGLSTGSDQFIWTVSNGVCPVSRDTMKFSVPASASIAYAGKDTSVCGTAAVFNATIPASGSGTWSVLSGTGIYTAAQAHSAVTGLSYGKNTYIWSVSNGVCPPSKDTVNIFSYQIPSKAFAGNDTTICGSSSHFAASTPSIGTGAWSLYTGTGIPASNAPRANVSGLSTGSDQFIWTVSNGVCPVSRDTMKFSVTIAPSPAYAGKDSSVCGAGGEINAAVPTIGTGIWSLYKGTGVFMASQPNTGVTGLSTGTNTFIWTVSNGVCPPSKDTVNIFSFQTPSKAFAGNDTTICGTASHFAASTPSIGTGAWSLYTGTGIPASNAPRANVSGLSTGSDQFIWTVSNGVCPVSRDTMKFSVPASASIAYAGKDTSVCGTAAVFNATAPALGSGIWSTLIGTGIYTAAQANSMVTGLSYGKNTFIWSVSNGVCPPSTDTVNVFSYQTPSKAFAGNDTTICGSSSHFAASNPSVGTGAWSLYTGTGAPVSNAPRANVNGLSTGSDQFIWTVSNGVCPVSVDTMQFNVLSLPSSAYAGNDTSVCGTTAELNATAPATGNGIWSLYSGSGIFNASQAHGAVNGLSYGLNQFIWTVSTASCGTRADTLNLFSYQLPSKAFAGNDTSVCGNSFQLNASTPLIGAGAWTLYSGAGTPASNQPKTSVSGLTPGQSIFIWTVSNGTCPPSRDSITIHVSQQASPAFAGNDTSICSTNAAFHASPPATGTGSWILLSGTGNFTATQYNSAVTNLGPGKNQFIWTVSNGSCPARRDTLIITRSLPPSQANAGNDTTICGLSTHFCAVPPSSGTGTWSLLSGSGIPSGNTPNANVFALAPGMNRFMWTVRNGVCPVSRDTVQITTAPAPSPASAGPDQTVCGSGTVLSANIPLSGTGSWSLNAGTGTMLNTSDPAAVVTGLSPGINAFTWTIKNGVCPPSVSLVHVTSFQMPALANAGPDISTSQPGVTMNAVIPSPGTGNWSVVSGSATVADLNNPNTAISGLQPGQTILRWTITNGPCTQSSDDVIITMSDFSIPNGFSPNGDGLNDYFVISGSESFSRVKLTVFNRWGNEVYANSDYKNNWNGINKSGDELAEDTYYYILELDTQPIVKGYVILKRK
jgi:gliding motility-associated-like protein